MIRLPTFPAMLRRMWSGGDVQQWIDTNIVPVWELLTKNALPEDFTLGTLHVADVYHAGSHKFYRALLGRVLSVDEAFATPDQFTETAPSEDGMVVVTDVETLQAALSEVSAVLGCPCNLDDILHAIDALKTYPKAATEAPAPDPAPR